MNARELHHQAMGTLHEAEKAVQEGATALSEVLMRKAYQYEREAALLLKAKVSAQPTRSILFRSAASLALKCNAFRDAEELVEAGLEGNTPSEIKEELLDIFAVAGRAENIKNYDDALLHYKRAIRINPAHLEVQLNLASITENYFSSHSLSWKHYHYALTFECNYSTDALRIANLLVDEFEDFNSARPFYEKALATNKDDTSTHYKFANLLERYTSDYQTARRHYELVIENEPGFAAAHHDLAILLSDHLKIYSLARAHYTCALEFDANNPNIHYNLALLIDEHFPDFENARYHYERALLFDTENADAYYNLSILLVQKYKNYKKARETYRIACAMNPGLINKVMNSFLKFYSPFDQTDLSLPQKRRASNASHNLINKKQK